MSDYTATIVWERHGSPFIDSAYSRAHHWHFDGGLDVPASASPHVVPLPLSVTQAIDPEGAFVAALASCHMLWFLAIAAKRGFIVEQYRDEATGIMRTNAEGKLAMTRVTLRPRVTFAQEKRPTMEQHHAMHHEAHDECFIASSVKTDVLCDAIDVTNVGEGPSQCTC